MPGCLGNSKLLCTLLIFISNLVFQQKQERTLPVRIEWSALCYCWKQCFFGDWFIFGLYYLAVFLAWNLDITLRLHTCMALDIRGGRWKVEDVLKGIFVFIVVKLWNQPANVSECWKAITLEATSQCQLQQRQDCIDLYSLVSPQGTTFPSDERSPHRTTSYKPSFVPFPLPLQGSNNIISSDDWTIAATLESFFKTICQNFCFCYINA